MILGTDMRNNRIDISTTPVSTPRKKAEWAPPSARKIERTGGGGPEHVNRGKDKGMVPKGQRGGRRKWGAVWLKRPAGILAAGLSTV